MVAAYRAPSGPNRSACTVRSRVSNSVNGLPSAPTRSHRGRRSGSQVRHAFLVHRDRPHEGRWRGQRFFEHRSFAQVSVARDRDSLRACLSRSLRGATVSTDGFPARAPAERSQPSEAAARAGKVNAKRRRRVVRAASSILPLSLLKWAGKAHLVREWKWPPGLRFVEVSAGLRWLRIPFLRWKGVTMRLRLNDSQQLGRALRWSGVQKIESSCRKLEAGVSECVTSRYQLVSSSNSRNPPPAWFDLSAMSPVRTMALPPPPPVKL